MLQKLSDQIAHCHQRAAESQERADKAADPDVRQDYLDLQRRWLMLAKSYELTERVGDFTHEVKRRLSVLTPAAPPEPAVPRVMCAQCGKRMQLRLIEPTMDMKPTDSMTYECLCGFTCEQRSERS